MVFIFLPDMKKRSKSRQSYKTAIAFNLEMLPSVGLKI